MHYRATQTHNGIQQAKLEREPANKQRYSAIRSRTVCCFCSLSTAIRTNTNNANDRHGEIEQECEREYESLKRDERVNDEMRIPIGEQMIAISK